MQVVRLVLHRRPAVTFVGASVGVEDGARVGTGDGTPAPDDVRPTMMDLPDVMIEEFLVDRTVRSYRYS